MKASQTVYLTRDRSRAVPAGDKDAAVLLVRAGLEISAAEAEKYEGAMELVGGKKKQPESEPEIDPEPVIETREPDVRHRDPKHSKHR